METYRRWLRRESPAPSHPDRIAATPERLSGAASALSCPHWALATLWSALWLPPRLSLLSVPARTHVPDEHPSLPGEGRGLTERHLRRKFANLDNRVPVPASDPNFSASSTLCAVPTARTTDHLAAFGTEQTEWRMRSYRRQNYRYRSSPLNSHGLQRFYASESLKAREILHC